jgi:hypothetical protein
MMEMKTRGPKDLQRFLDLLFKPEDGWIELRALPGKSRQFVRPGDVNGIQDFVDRNKDQNLYFGVAARKNRSNGRFENCNTLRCFFVDLDFKDFASPAAARRQLDQFPLQPSLIVETGGGLHAYWLLERALDLHHPGSGVKESLRRLAIAVGGDLSAAEPARILRLPGSLNHKYDPPREVLLVD